MLRAVTSVVGTLVLLTALGTSIAVPGGPGDDPGPPGCLPGNALENENVRIWFHGFMGFVKVFDNTGDEEEGLYQYNTGSVVELDSDGAPVAHMKLDHAFPQGSACEVEETDEYVNLTLVIDATVREAQGPPVGEATATFAYNFNKSANGAKFDLLVDGWPWQSDGTLAYAFTVKSSWDMEVAENGIGFKNSTGEPKGHIEWAMNATARYDDGSEEEAEVVSGWTQTEGKVDVSLEFTNVTAGYVELDYDPWASMGDWIIVLDRLYSLDPVEALLPGDAYRTVKSLLWGSLPL